MGGRFARVNQAGGSTEADAADAVLVASNHDELLPRCNRHHDREIGHGDAVEIIQDAAAGKLHGVLMDGKPRMTNQQQGGMQELPGPEFYRHGSILATRGAAPNRSRRRSVPLSAAADKSA